MAQFLNGANFAVLARAYIVSECSGSMQSEGQTRNSMASSVGYILGPIFVVATADVHAMVGKFHMNQVSTTAPHLPLIPALTALQETFPGVTTLVFLTGLSVLFCCYFTEKQQALQPSHWVGATSHPSPGRHLQKN